MNFLLAYLHFILADSKDQGQGQAHFDGEYLVNGDRMGKYYYCHHIESHVWAFNWHIYN